MIGLAEADDRVVWDYAVGNGMTVVTQDEDFRDRSQRDGHPPKVVMIDLKKPTWRETLKLINENAERIVQFIALPDVSLMLLPS